MSILERQFLLKKGTEYSVCLGSRKIVRKRLEQDVLLKPNLFCPDNNILVFDVNNGVLLKKC